MVANLQFETIDKFGISEIHQLHNYSTEDDPILEDKVDRITILDHILQDFLDYQKRP